MAKKRTCPKCGMEWYSADTLTVWLCEKCGAKIPPERERDSESNHSISTMGKPDLAGRPSGSGDSTDGETQ